MEIGNYIIAIVLGVAVMLGFTGLYGDMRSTNTGMDQLSPSLEQVSNHMVVSVNESIISMQTTLKSGNWLTTATDLVFIAPMNAVRTLIDITSGSWELFSVFFGNIYILPAWSPGIASTLIWAFLILAITGVLLKFSLFK